MSEVKRKRMTLVARSERFAEHPRHPSYNWLDWVAYAWRVGYRAGKRAAQREVKP